MKKLFIAIALLAICGTVNAQDKKAATTQSAGTGKLAFKSEIHDFGNLTEGPDADVDFVFTNTGKSPVVITNATAGCGCTSPEWSKEPIMPGKSSKIHVAYHTKGRPGPFTKSVTVTSNAEQPSMVLTIKGTVNAATTADIKN